MRFLALNTAGPTVEVVLADGTHVRNEDSRQASVTLMPAVDTLLSQAKLSLADLDFVACITGPGSFTGIRIGISTARALCYATGKPALGIHYLQMLAYNANADGFEKILCVSDGSNGTAYIAEFDGHRRACAPCKCVSQQEAVATASAYHGAVCVDERMATLLPQAFAPEKNCHALLRAAAACYAQAGSYTQLLPIYIRESQAERDLREKERQ